jgi:hypothetical protein
VPDNLKTGVERPDLYDPKINRSYAELAAHYGVLVDPARACKPKDKPAVERPNPVIPSVSMAKSTPSHPTEMITWSVRTILRTLGGMSGIARRDSRVSGAGRTIEVMTSFPPRIL